ncbi:MAG: transport-associated protein [Planctomycetaceae bacterium]|nr:transport-associated protein [Planctomycetaceae bacterium]
MKAYLLLSVGVLALSGCQEAAAKKTPMEGEKKVAPAADNSAVNERDRSGATKTPIDQNENDADIKTTADIRKRVVGEKDFSVSARNVKIITADGKVTLRGPVKTQKERDTIEQIARDVAGKDKVDSQLEVAE